MTDLREALAAEAHRAWTGWMEYLFTKSRYIPGLGIVIIPKWAVDRWTRQMATAHENLSEQEKESDRKEADRYFLVMESRLAEIVEPVAQDTIKEFQGVVGRMQDVIVKADKDLEVMDEALTQCHNDRLLLLNTLRDAISSASAHKTSIGSIGNTYCPQISVKQVERWQSVLDEVSGDTTQ